MKTIVFCFGILALFLQISSSCGQEELLDKEVGEGELGTGVDESKDVQDTCEGAAGPRPINGVFSPGRTDYATVDDVNGGFCGVDIDRPGIWWWVNGTGEIIKSSSCHGQTDIKVKVSVFTGSCDDLQCVAGGAEPDYECPILKRENDLGEWDTMATAISFPSILGQDYYILVQQEAQDQRGTVWMNFKTPAIPQNDNCVDAIGPVPRDLTPIMATSVEGTKSNIHDYCGGDNVPSLYPGTWFQIMGTGKSVSVMSCSLFNFDGYAFSVYSGGNCDSLECVKGRYEIEIEGDEKCFFGTNEVERKMTKFSFDTVDRSRYYIYVHFARTRADSPTADFRFFVDDEEGGNGSSSGGHMIQFDGSMSNFDISDKWGYNGGTKGSSGSSGEDGSGSSGDKDGKRGNGESSSSSIVMFRQSGISFFALLVSWMIRDIL